jgi:hypothetical protein
VPCRNPVTRQRPFGSAVHTLSDEQQDEVEGDGLGSEHAGRLDGPGPGPRAVGQLAVARWLRGTAASAAADASFSTRAQAPAS